MANGISVKQTQRDFLEIFSSVCLSYIVITMLTIFFEEDLFRIFTPFLAPFLLLFIILGYLVLAVISLLYIPFQIRKVSWRVFIPLIINLITFLIVYYLYNPLGDVRIKIGFRINENRLNRAASWITQSIQNGDINIEETRGTVILPKEYKSLADRGQVLVTNEYGVITILFFRGGGMFEYGPSFVYRSDNIASGFEVYGDIQCNRWLSPNWYDCY